MTAIMMTMMIVRIAILILILCAPSATCVGTKVTMPSATVVIVCWKKASVYLRDRVGYWLVGEVCKDGFFKGSGWTRSQKKDASNVDSSTHIHVTCAPPQINEEGKRNGVGNANCLPPLYVMFAPFFPTWCDIRSNVRLPVVPHEAVAEVSRRGKL